MLAKNIKEKRLNKGLGVKALANLVGVSNSVIFNIESGKTKNPRIDIVCKIAKVFNVTLDELVYGKKVKVSPGTSFLFSKEEVDKWVYLEIK